MLSITKALLLRATTPNFPGSPTHLQELHPIALNHSTLCTCANYRKGSGT